MEEGGPWELTGREKAVSSGQRRPHLENVNYLLTGHGVMLST